MAGAPLTRVQRRAALGDRGPASPRARHCGVGRGPRLSFHGCSCDRRVPRPLWACSLLCDRSTTSITYSSRPDEAIERETWRQPRHATSSLKPTVTSEHRGAPLVGGTPEVTAWRRTVAAGAGGQTEQTAAWEGGRRGQDGPQTALSTSACCWRQSRKSPPGPRPAGGSARSHRGLETRTGGRGDRCRGARGSLQPVPEGVVRSPQGGQTGAEAVKPRLAIAAGPWRHVDPGSRGAERQPPAVPGASRPHIRTPHSSDLLPPGQLQRAEKSLSQFPFI